MERIKKDLSNNNKIINEKINSIKEEISSSFGNTSNASSVIDEENYLDMSFLETEEEEAENIADINERRDVRKKDNKARTFAHPDNTEEKADVRKKDNTSKEEMYFEINKLINKVKNDFDVIEEISLGRKEYIHINDFIDFLNYIKSGEIDSSDIKRAYNNRIAKIRNKLYNTQHDSDIYINEFWDILDKYYNKGSSGKGLTISALPILLSKLDINSSEKLISDIEQLIKNLYDNKQITKQVHNSLIKAKTYKNDSSRAS